MVTQPRQRRADSGIDSASDLAKLRNKRRKHVFSNPANNIGKDFNNAGYYAESAHNKADSAQKSAADNASQNL